MVFRLAMSYLKNRAEAEDVCQTVFVRLMEKGQHISPGKEGAWLAAVTANLCKDLLRSARHRRTEALSEDLPAEAPERSGVLEAVLSLSPGERAAVYLYYYEGYSTAEIGKILSLSRTAVTTRLERARKHLRGRLEE